MAHAPLTTLPLRNYPDAVKTAIGWAHPVTGEQLVSIRDLPPPVAPFYKPNSGATAFIDPDATLPANTVLPAITGTPKVGTPLNASTGTWTGTPTIQYSYQWQKGTVDIAGATAASYTPVVGDVGATIRVKVTALNGAGPVTVNSAATTAVAA